MEKKTNLYEKSTYVISYLTLRKLIGILGMSLPIILVLGSILIADCEGIHSSVSDYYHTVMRNVFVGVLCSVGLFLFSYRGYEKKDNIAGDLGCLFALGIAFFPTAVDCTLTCNIPLLNTNPIIGKIHLISATLFFLVLVYFSLFLFVKGNTTNKQKRKRNIVFKICGYTMLTCILIIGIYFIIYKPTADNCTVAPYNYNIVFWFETIALLAFGISWLTKGQLILRDLNEDS